MKKSQYENPLCQVIPLDNLTTLCSSPVSGGNEGIGFDSWDEIPSPGVIKRLFSFLLIAFLAISCNVGSIELIPVVLDDDKEMTFNAILIDEDATKTEIHNTTSIWWSPKDKINVFYGNKYSGVFTSDNTEPAAQATFSGNLTGSPSSEDNADYWAIYPYNENNTCDGESVVLTVPSEQNGVVETFANGLFPAIAKSKGTNLSFYNVCGGARFSVTQEGIKSIVFKSNNGEALSGKVQVAFGNDGKPYIKSFVDAVDSVVVFAPEEGFVIGEYYFAVMIPQSLTKGLKVSMYKNDASAVLVKEKSIIVNRSNFGKLDKIDKEVVFLTAMPEAIELGLSVKWASFNIGATRPEEYGYYFAWGETALKKDYDWYTYKWCKGSEKTLTKYCSESSYGYQGYTDSKTILDPEDDVAYATLGGSWRMPTNDEIDELIRCCSRVWTEKNGICGYLYSGPSGRSIFLPASGYRNNISLLDVGVAGSYWTASPSPGSPSEAKSFIFTKQIGALFGSSGRYLGRSVRPVFGPIPVTGISLDYSSISFTEKNTTQKLTATILPANAANKNVIWTSSNPDVATVSQDGIITSKGYGITEIIATSEQSNYTASCWVTVVAKPKAVDLGLSVKWASFNIGATSEEEFGNYYAWGESCLKWEYEWWTYYWCNGSERTMTKYCDNSSYGYLGYLDTLIVLAPEDDVASTLFGNDWRIPTYNEQMELITQCTWIWTTSSGINGYCVTGSNGNSIFIPAAGYRSGFSRNSAGEQGGYWSSSLASGSICNHAYCLTFSSSGVGQGNIDTRFRGRSVRPVCK